MTQGSIDFATGKPVDLSKPEEQVRQEYERVLVDSYGYLKADLNIEVRIPRGTGYFPDKADIVIYRSDAGRDPASDIVGIVETKRPTRTDGLSQLKSYMTATSSEWGVWTNGTDIAYLYKDGNRIRDDFLNNIPVRGQSVRDVGRLNRSDLHPFGRSELKSAFRRILQTLYANTNIGRREKLGSEMIKVIFAKLKDEGTFQERPPRFRAEAGEDPASVMDRVSALFAEVKHDLSEDGIFLEHEEIVLDARSVAWVVGQLERGSLLTTESDVVGDAFEVFSESKFIGEKGEFFTPRGVVKIAVKLVQPSPGNTMCDPACGSGGFLTQAMKYMWELMESDPRWRNSPDLQAEKRKMAAKSFFGIDKETDLVKIAKAHMAIAGDGRSNIVHENTVHRIEEFDGETQRHFVRQGNLRQFDMILTNPPYGTKIKILEHETSQFSLGHKWKRDKRRNKWKQTPNVVQRDPYVLFIERCLEMTRLGGVIGMVLPESVFHAPTLGYIRQYLLANNNLVAVIDLPHNTFRPHCNAKTCFVVLKKGERQQEGVIMATPQEMGHDLQGKPLHRPGTFEVWDDLTVVLDELDDADSMDNEHVFVVPFDSVKPDILVPRFYRALLKSPVIPPGFQSVRLGKLVLDGTVKVWDGHGSPPGETKGLGTVPYIRVADIVNWEMYRNPVSMIPEDTYLSILRNKETPAEGDVIFVRRGSYRIGTVAMASSRDAGVLLTRELLTLRVQLDNAWKISPFYLLAMLSSSIVQKQIPNYVFVDTTLPNIGDRWKYLEVPIHINVNERQKASDEVEQSMRDKWSAQDRINTLRKTFGGIVT